jgi:hypothetical protein
MIAGRIHAIMAAGLANPDLLARWQQQPELLRTCGVDPATFDLEAIRKFAGLSAKVRHNGLRFSLPNTFRFLSLTGLEIEVFAAYAAHHSREGTSYAATNEERIIDLADFLQGWLDPNRLEHSMLWDLIRHETALAQLRKVITSPDQFYCENNPTARSVPHIAGHIILHEMNSDPRQVGKLLRGKSFDPEKARRERVRLGYWKPGRTAEIYILELDELGFFLLSLVDGRKSVTDFSRRLNGKSRPARNLVNAFRDLARLGVICFDDTVA